MCASIEFATMGDLIWRQHIETWRAWASARRRYAPARLLVAQSRRRLARLNAIENPPAALFLFTSAILNLAGICFCRPAAADKQFPKANIWGSSSSSSNSIAAAAVFVSASISGSIEHNELSAGAKLGQEFEIFQAQVSIHLLLSKLTNYLPNPSNPNRVTHLE